MHDTCLVSCGLSYQELRTTKKYFDYHLILTGQFYEEKGIPESYEAKTPEAPCKAKVFRYDSFYLVKK